MYIINFYNFTASLLTCRIFFISKFNRKGEKMLENLTIKQKRIFIIVGILIAISVLYFIYQGIGNEEEIDLESEMLISNHVTNEVNTDIENSTETEEDMVIVHVTGAVKNPGIVKLKEGSRIEDAIKAAGGLTENADISDVNLAYILEDGIKLRIPSISDEEISQSDILTENNGENIIEENNTSSTSTNNSININKATETELDTLPGIGPSLASKIIEYREQNGKFSSIEDIKNVSGIGESKYESIKDFICVK